MSGEASKKSLKMDFNVMRSASTFFLLLCADVFAARMHNRENYDAVKSIPFYFIERRMVAIRT